MDLRVYQIADHFDLYRGLILVSQHSTLLGARRAQVRYQRRWDDLD